MNLPFYLHRLLCMTLFSGNSSQRRCISSFIYTQIPHNVLQCSCKGSIWGNFIVPESIPPYSRKCSCCSYYQLPESLLRKVISYYIRGQGTVGNFWFFFTIPIPCEISHKQTQPHSLFFCSYHSSSNYITEYVYIRGDLMAVRCF